MLGSWASITADLIKFFRSKDLNIYTELADTLNSMADADDEPTDPTLALPIPVMAALMTIRTRAYAFLSEMLQVKLEIASFFCRHGGRTFEIPGRYTPLEAPSRPEQIALPDLQTINDYATAPCKHECAVLTQSRHVRHAYDLWRDGTITQRTLMLS